MIKIVVVIGFIVAFAAGLVVGVDTRTVPLAMPTSRPGNPRGFLTATLNLNPQQQDQMKRIWADVADHGSQGEKRHEYRKQRDDAIAALVQPGDMAAYDQILQKYNDQLTALEQSSREAFQGAVEQTKQILTPEQRTKYDELLARHQWDRGAHDRDRGNKDPNRRGDDRATSEPRPQSS